MILINYEEKKEFVEECFFGNVVLVCFIMVYVWLYLYEILEKLGECVLYFDIDSIIFKIFKFDDLYYLLIGNYLGELINEIKVEDGYIIEFVLGGFKNYVYCMFLGREECKVWGFMLNWINFKVINFEVIKFIICIL